MTVVIAQFNSHMWGTDTGWDRYSYVGHNIEINEFQELWHLSKVELCWSQFATEQGICVLLINAVWDLKENTHYRDRTT